MDTSIPNPDERNRATLNIAEEIKKLNDDIALLNALLMEARRSGGGGGGPGATTFLDLTDTPASYVAQAGKTIRVKAAENGLEFIDRITTFLGLTDTPASYVGQAGLYCRVNPGANAIIFSDASAIDADMVDGYHAEDFLFKFYNKKFCGILPYYSATFSAMGCGFSVSLLLASSVWDDSTWTRWATNNAVNDFRFIRSSQVVCHRQGDYDAQWVIKTDADIANMRIWCDLCSQNHTATINNLYHFAGFSYDTAVSGNWYYRTQNGSGAGGITTGSLAVAVAASTVYYLRAVSRYADGVIDFYINGTLRATVAATLPGAQTGLIAHVMSVTLAAVSKYINFGSFLVEWNGQ